jgi:hypothetical protein
MAAVECPDPLYGASEGASTVIPRGSPTLKEPDATSLSLHLQNQTSGGNH